MDLNSFKLFASLSQKTVSISLLINLKKMKNAIFKRSEYLIGRSSGPEVFCQKGVLKNFSKFIGKHICQSLFSNKVADLNTFIYRTYPVAGTEYELKVTSKPFIKSL